MVNKPSVTVVVPIYNVEKYLRRCIDSLLAQDYSLLEIILVDDGSPDNSGAICDKYASTHPNIKVIHKANGGLSSARKAGYEVAQGELIAFVDSDDYVAPQFIGKLASPFADKNVQLSICGYATHSSKGDIAVKLPYDKAIIEYSEIVPSYILPLIGTDYQTNAINIPGFVCIRMYRRELLEPYHFVSEREYYTEDILMNILYAKRMTGNMAVINESLYFYCVNPGSLTLKYRDGVFSMLMARFNFCKEITAGMAIDKLQLNLRLAGNLVAVVTRSIYNIGRIRNYRHFKKELKLILNQPEVRELFLNRNWPQKATWHKIIYYTYLSKSYFLLYKLLKTRRVI